jgi:Pyridoxal phosphate biosynthesis protein
MNENLITIGISHGDMNGVAYELIIKAFEDSTIFEMCVPILYGSSKAMAYYRKVMELPHMNVNVINNAENAAPNRLNVINCVLEEAVVELAQPSASADQYAEKALSAAINDLKSGMIDVLVTCPSNQDELKELESQIASERKALRMFVNDSFRIAVATDKTPLAEVSGVLTKESLAEQLKVLNRTLIEDFMITCPRIAVLSLNPGMGVKEQRYGKEETEVIIPAIQSAGEEKVTCFGPYSADDFFGTNDFQQFDAVLAMYYDQGLIAFRSIAGENGVFYTANLPYISASPNHHVSYEKAGKNLLTGDSLRSAIYLSIDAFSNRETSKEINANPLKKQYFERGSDNEKLDLTGDEA